MKQSPENHTELYVTVPRTIENARKVTWTEIWLASIIIAAFYTTQSFSTVFTRIHCWFLSWIGEISFRPSHSICMRNILISSFYLYLGLHSDLFTSCFQNKSVWIYVLSHSLHTICPYFVPWFEYHNNLWWGNQTRWEKCQALRIFQQLRALNPTYAFKMKVTQIPWHVQIRTKVGHTKHTSQDDWHTYPCTLSVPSNPIFFETSMTFRKRSVKQK